MERRYDVVIIGSGPNGLAAGILLSGQGKKVLIVEAADTAGGGMRTSTTLTLPGFAHDICSAVHPMGVLSPYLSTLGLDKYGLEWAYPEASVAHPMPDGPAVLLTRSVADTAARLEVDARRYQRLMQPLVDHVDWLLADALKPLGIPEHPFFLAGFGLKAIQPALGFARRTFKGERARALFAGCAAHSILPFENLMTSAMGLVFLATGHAVDWPVAKGGSKAIADALLKLYTQQGGDIRYGERITRMEQLPPAQAYMFDTDPYQLADIAGDALPTGYRARLKRFRQGPGVFKLDFALNGPIPWRDPACLKASTVHLGGTLDAIAEGERDAWEGRHPKTPFVLVSQQSAFDASRAPQGQHTGWAYCHVPNGSTVDMSEVIIAQIERSAPGFRASILAQHAMNTRDFQHYNPNYFGGAVTGGAADITQLFTRPVVRWNPYTTPNDRIFICSASTPPGGGVHGMCGYHAARTVINKLR